MGSYVRVEDHMGNSIGKGMFNPLSTYRVRLFTRSFEREYDLEFPDVIASRIRQAILVRKSLLLPSKITTAYRLIKYVNEIHQLKISD
jgi:23S rRNA G2069 N7-methylase RlmK/C1962 C5-methylase RlmI